MSANISAQREAIDSATITDVVRQDRGDSTCFFEIEPDRIDEVEATVLDGYQAGLREGG